jgi:CO/xanthine dehydrogenase Mo-binding subunit
MAIGDVLLGGCPNDHNGPGNGLWNFNLYSITKWNDIPHQELIILPPAAGETSARGIAESVMCPIAPAILNALAMATGGKRFTELPVTSKTILKALA